MRTIVHAILFRTRQVAEARKTIAAKIHQLDGRQRYFPPTIPTEKNSAAQKSGCRAENCRLLREGSCVLPTGDAGLPVFSVLGGTAMLADTKI